MLLAFMAEETANAPVGSVEEFLDTLPRGEGIASCLFAWIAFEHQQAGRVSEEEFADECRRLGKTTTIYGKEYLVGIDEPALRRWFVSLFEE